jgi:hypothetical protein
VFRNSRDLAKEWRNGFILAANRKVGSPNAEPLTLESSNYSCPLDTTETYLAKESKTLANKPALTLFPNDEPKNFANKLALTLFLYPAKEPKALANELVFTSFSHPVKDNILANELDHTTYVRPTASKKRLDTGLKNTLSKNLRNNASTSNQRR